MKIPLLMIVRSKVALTDLTMNGFYIFFKISRQGFHQAVTRLKQIDAMMKQVSEKVKSYRRINDRRAGSRTLYYNLGIKEQYNIGITKFEQLMSKYELSLQPLRIRIVTTKSCNQSWNYKNLCNGLTINRFSQLVVGDITYVSLGKNRYYLFCLIDAFSLRIVGYCLSTRMRKQEAIAALSMLIKLRGESQLKKCIHHTDGGGQYFSGSYLKLLSEKEMRVSVAQNCLENGLAEQKNGYIKNHLLPTVKLNNPDNLSNEIDRIMHFYNHQRKQAELNWKSPVEYEEYVAKSNKKLYVRLHDFESKIASETKRF